MIDVLLTVFVDAHDGEACMSLATRMPFAPPPGLQLYQAGWGDFLVSSVTWAIDAQRFECWLEDINCLPFQSIDDGVTSLARVGFRLDKDGIDRDPDRAPATREKWAALRARASALNDA